MLKKDISGVAYPFVRNDAGVFDIKYNYDLIEADIEQSIRTRRMSRPMLKDIGCSIDDLLFLNDDVQRNTAILTFIKDSVENDIDNVIIESVEVVNIEDEGQSYTFDMKYSYNGIIKEYSFIYRS